MIKMYWDIRYGWWLLGNTVRWHGSIMSLDMYPASMCRVFWKNLNGGDRP